MKIPTKINAKQEFVIKIISLLFKLFLVIRDNRADMCCWLLVFYDGLKLCMINLSANGRQTRFI